MMYKCKGHFLAFGDVRKRREGGKEFHALRLQCLVRHTPINVDTQTQLSQEMSESLPLNVAINCESDLSGFEITSSQFASGAKFIIATAAMLSQDVGLAKSILEELYRDLPMIKKQGLSLGSARLAELVSARLVDCLKVISLRHHTVWRTTRDHDELVHGLDAAEAGLRIDGSATEFHNTRAIAAFVLDHSVNRARQNLMVCAKFSPKDPSWRYGLAFLAAHDGDLNTAWRHYRDAFGKDVVDALPNEIEEFISWVLSKEPGRIQLHYCLGILNLKRKGDKVQANADFAEFLRQCPADKFVEAQQRARRYIERT